MPTYRVTHSTAYTYAGDVSLSYGQLHMLPRDTTGQRCRSSEVVVDPFAGDYRERRDFFGNRVCFLAIHEPHRALTVTADSVVEVDRRRGDLQLLDRTSWERARTAIHESARSGSPEAAQFLLDSPRVVADESFRDYALRAFRPGRTLLEAVLALSAQIHAEFEYAPGSTSVTTPLAQAFTQRRGVCQDLAHLAIACLRSIGLPARYVSGYLETDPPPGAPKLQGVDGSHAWLSVLAPGSGWLDVDPTNDQLASDRYIVTAYGRDYGDVPPMNGVIYTESATEALTVSVDVVAIGE
jgi:transglutaminase-like putative cysteine protease